MLFPADTASAEAQEAIARARALLDADVLVYGNARSGPLYDNMLRYLIDPDLHDFRLREIAGGTGLLVQPSTVLDLGCGPGTFTLKARALGHEAYGIDLSSEKIQLAQAWARARGSAGDESRFQLADAGDMPFDEAFFDVVSSYHVLEHVADLPSVLYEAVRVTKRGGWLHLCAPDYRMSYDTHYCMPWPRFMPAGQAERWTRAMNRPPDGIGTFFYRTAPEVTTLLQALGCKVQALAMKTHYNGQIAQWDGSLTLDPIVFRSDADVDAIAREVLRLQSAGGLPPMYGTCLEFTILAQRL